MKVKATFKEGGIQGKVYFKEFECFQLNDINLPNFIPKSKMKEVAKSLKVGDFIETEDGWVVPIIRSWQNFFRIAAKKSGTYSRWHVKNGQKIYFDPPKEHKITYEYSAMGRRGEGKRLTKMQQKFCWQMAKEWDPVKALKVAGYALSDNPEYNQKSAQKMLCMKKIQQGITNAIRTHLLAANLNEAEFVLLPKKKIIDELVSLGDCLHKQMLVNSKIDECYLDSYLKTIAELSKNINDMADWLGYNLK